jgi:hypothetical protein
MEFTKEIAKTMANYQLDQSEKKLRYSEYIRPNVEI